VHFSTANEACAFSAMTLLNEYQKGHPACKKISLNLQRFFLENTCRRPRCHRK